MGSKKLNEEQLNKLGELLDIAIVNRENPHQEDLRKTALLIFNLVQKGYYFGENELENIMELSGGYYSERMERYLKEIVWVCNALNNDINDYANDERFELKDFE